MRTRFSNPKKLASWILIAFCGAVMISCSKDDEEGNEPEPPVEVHPPIVLECDRFIEEGGTLTDDPLAPIDYIVKCLMRIKSDVVVEPGVTIAFDTDAGLKIEEDASFVAVGTADAPILFTGVDKARGAWAGVSFLSPDVKNKMEYVTIEYGGGEKIHANVEAANITVSYDTRLKINNCTFKESENYGMFVWYNTQELHVNNSTFTKNLIPLYSHATPQLMTAINASNDYAGNDEDRVYLHGGALVSSTTWNKINVPYLLTGGTLRTVEDLTILTIEPGVHVYVAQGSEISTGDDTTFHFVGTEEEPIIFEGVNPTPGSWDGFVVHAAVNSTMKHMVIAHAGGTNATFAHEAAIGIKYGSVITLDNIHFSDLYGCAVKVVNDNNVVSTSNLTIDNTNTGNVDTEDCIL
jgi:hypothetical protein